MWDRFYHCILPQDGQLIGVLRELGLEGDLRWRQTGTGYYAKDRFFSMSSNADFLRFPLLSLVDKARLGATILYATKVADPWSLYGITAEDWLTRLCGRRAYENFWRPLLRAKFGPFYNQIAAVFIWATLTRLFGARRGSTAKENLGYVRGGTRAFSSDSKRSLRSKARWFTRASPVSAIRGVTGEAGKRSCELEWKNGDGAQSGRFD